MCIMAIRLYETRRHGLNFGAKRAETAEQRSVKILRTKEKEKRYVSVRKGDRICVWHA